MLKDFHFYLYSTASATTVRQFDGCPKVVATPAQIPICDFRLSATSCDATSVSRRFTPNPFSTPAVLVCEDLAGSLYHISSPFTPQHQTLLSLSFVCLGFQPRPPTHASESDGHFPHVSLYSISLHVGIVGCFAVSHATQRQVVVPTLSVSSFLSFLTNSCFTSSSRTSSVFSQPQFM